MSEKELTYGERIKQPFPKLEDIEWVMVEAPEWLEGQMIKSFYASIEIGVRQPHKVVEHLGLQKSTYLKAKEIYENSQDFKVTWQLKQTNPHADIKAEYEKAIADGKIVKVFSDKHCLSGWYEDKIPEWLGDYKYQLRYYNIDWNKLLSWSYANGEFVECEFSTNDLFMTVLVDGFLTSYSGGFFGVGVADESYEYCRLAKGVEIKDEWLKEIK